MNHSSGPRGGVEFHTQKILIVATILLIIAISAALTQLADPELGWLESELGPWGWAGLAFNFGVVAYVWISGLRRRFDLLEPIYLMSLLFLLVFVLRPLQIISQYDSRVYLVPNKPELFQTALLFGALGNICFVVGYRSSIGMKLSNKFPRLGMHWRFGRLVLISVVYTLIGVLGFEFAVSRSGGVESFIATLQGRSMLSESYSQIFAAMSVLSYVVTALLVSYCTLTKRLGILVIISMVVSTGMGLLQGGRAVVLVNWMAFFAIYYYLRGSRRLITIRALLATVVFVAAAIVFTVYLGIQRNNIQQGNEDLLQSTPVILPAAELGNGFLNEFSQFDWFVIVLDATPSAIPYQYGRTFVQLFAQFVPRMFWQDKPLPIEYVVTRLLTGVESGSPFTIIGELYLNFLWPGIIVGMIVFGILVRSVYGYLQSNPGNPGVVLTYGYIYASLFQLYTRSFAPMMFFLIIFLIPAGLALWFIRDRTVPEASLH